jgi:hypothetical protein
MCQAGQISESGLLHDIREWFSQLIGKSKVLISKSDLLHDVRECLTNLIGRSRVLTSESDLLTSGNY